MRSVFVVYVLFLPFVGWAQSVAHGARGSDSLLQELKINEVVITGQYSARSKEQAVQKVDIIDRKKIDAMAAQNLRDVLSNELEMRLSYDAVFGTSLNMQGSVGYGADAKILIDGVPVVGKQNGAVDLSQINLANIERIELIKGPMSVSYGTDAIAGTVNLITKKTVKNGFELSGGVYYETIGTYNAHLRYGVKVGKAHSISVDASRNFFAGWSPGMGVSLFDFGAAIADTQRALLWKPRAQYQAGFQYGYKRNKTTYNYKGSYFYELITSRGMPLSPYYEQAFDNYFHTHRTDNAVFINSDFVQDKHISVMVAYNAYKRIKKESAHDLTTLNEVFDPLLQDTSRYSEWNSRSTFSSSKKDVRVNYELGYDVNIQFANSTQIAGREKDIGNYAVFASTEYKLLKMLTIRPGLRYAYNTRYKAPLVPSVNFMFILPHEVKLRASYARGFRQPGLKELYFDFVDINHNIHGNTSLKAEYSDNYTVSLNQSGAFNRVGYKLSITSFYNNVKDLITLAGIAGSALNEYTYVNIGSFRSKGLQAGADATIRSFTVSAGLSYCGTYNLLSEQTSVPSFNYSPELRSSIMYGVKKYGLTLSVFYKYTGRFIRYVSGDNNEPVQLLTEGYHIADVSFSKQFMQNRLTIAMGCKNLFDVQNVLGSQQGGAHSGSSSYTAIGNGRNYFLKTEFNFSK